MNSFKEYLISAPISLKQMVETLHDIIVASSDKFKVEIKWRSPTYFINRNICSIQVHRGHVNLQFFYGALYDIENIMEGTGKEMKHIKFKRFSDIKKPQLQELLSKAIDYDKKFSID